MICKHCEKICKNKISLGLHERICLKNPNKVEYKNGMSGRKGSNQYSKAKKLGIEKPIMSIETRQKMREGHIGLKHTEESKKKISEKALKSKHRRVLRSTREYVKKDGTILLLDSSWEEILAKRLDELNIEWIRPKSIKWSDKEGKSHNYFPDFYLPLYDIYLDPKNDQVYRMSLEKIECVQKILPNLKILRTLDECKNFIAT